MLAFSWSTFLIEIVNFVVLVWLLTRLLYQPVMRTLAAREQNIKDQLTRAAQTQAEATELSRRFDARLGDWENEKSQLRERFNAELAAQRTRWEEDLKSAIARERAQAAAADKLRERDEQRRLSRDAARDAAKFGARLLSRMACPALEERMVRAMIEDLRSLGTQQRSTLTRSLNGKQTATITTRYPFPDLERAELEKALAEILGGQPKLSFQQDEALISGVRIELGHTTLEANVGSELRWFAQIENDAGD